MTTPEFIPPAIERVPHYLSWVVDRRDFGNEFAVWLVARGAGGEVEKIGAPVSFTMRERDPARVVWQPATVSLSEPAAIGLMTALWKSGIRPAVEPSDLETRGEILRLDAHLADMRRLVFSTPFLINGPERTP
jgi:hypothetical protein